MLLGETDTAPLTGGATLEKLWGELHGPLLSYIWRRVGDEEAAHDLLQEVFLRAQEAAASATPKNLRTWIYGIARNLIADHFRAVGHADFDESEYLSSVEAQTHNPRNENWQMGRCLAFYMRELEPKYRAPLQLAINEGLTQREIGERLGLSTSGAKSRVQRARAKLREMLNDCCSMEFDRRGNILNYRERATGCTNGCDCRNS